MIAPGLPLARRPIIAVEARSSRAKPAFKGRGREKSGFRQRRGYRNSKF